MKQTHERPSASGAPRFELAGSLQGVMNSIEQRSFSLDLQQEAALEAIGTALIDGVDTGYIEMATSTGKTAIESLLAEATVNAGKRVLMLAPTKSIAQQLYGRGQMNVTGLERFTNVVERDAVKRHFGHTSAGTDTPAVVTTYASFLSDYRNDHKTLGQFDVVIADECHRSLGEATSQALRTAYPNAFKIGFSATPDYAIDRTSDEVYERSLFEFSLLDAIEAGRTAPIRTLIYQTDDTLRTIDPRKEFSDRELEPLMYSMPRNGTALELAKAFAANGQQGIIACIAGNRNYHARLMADLLQQHGLRAGDVGSHVSDEEMSLRLKQFHDGELDVLTFTRSLEEGWDSDKASFAINLAPTASPVRTKQLMGRVLRRKSNGQESVYVDFLDEKEGIAKVQYTAMHALGLEEIDMMRVLGRQSSHGPEWKPTPLASFDHISAQLYQRLLGLQGKLVSEVSVKEVVNPLFKQWENKLAAEGMPAELPDNDILPASLNRRIEKAYNDYVEQHGEAPTNIAQLAEAIGDANRSRTTAMGNYGLRIGFDEAVREAEPVSDDAVLDQHFLQSDLDKVFETLPVREAEMLRLRFGLDDGYPKANHEIGAVHGLSASRVGQIELKTMDQLRHPQQSTRLRGYLDGYMPRDDLEQSASKRDNDASFDSALKFLNQIHTYRASWRGSTGSSALEQSDLKRVLDELHINDYDTLDTTIALIERSFAHEREIERREGTTRYGDFYADVHDVLRVIRRHGFDARP